MALPKFEVSTYDIKLPISQLDVKYRPYLVKEEKNLMIANETGEQRDVINCLLYTSPSPRDIRRSRMPSSA